MQLMLLPLPLTADAQPLLTSARGGGLSLPDDSSSLLSLSLLAAMLCVWPG
jgi:hypothetical protein